MQNLKFKSWKLSIQDVVQGVSPALVSFIRDQCLSVMFWKASNSISNHEVPPHLSSYTIDPILFMNITLEHRLLFFCAEYGTNTLFKATSMHTVYCYICYRMESIDWLIFEVQFTKLSWLPKYEYVHQDVQKQTYSESFINSNTSSKSLNRCNLIALT